MKKLFATFKILLLLVLLGAVGTGAFISWIFYRAMPDYAGKATLPGLAASVHIVRDEHGVPHIFADTMDDAARALGYVHASERLFQMEMQRRAGQGRLSEIFGPDMLGVDKFICTLGLYHLAESSASSLFTGSASITSGLCRRSQRMARYASKRPASGICSARCQTGAMANREFHRLGQADGPAAEQELFHRNPARRLAKKLTPAQMDAIFATPADTPVTMEPGQKNGI